MINFDGIEQSLLEIASQWLVDDLSTMAGENGPIPSVIMSKDEGVSPATPFAQLDFMASRKDGWSQGEGLDENKQYAIIETIYFLQYAFMIVGGDATRIAHKLESYFRLDPVMDKLQLDSGGTLQNTFDVISVPKQMSTHLVDAAVFEITLSYTDRYTDSPTAPDSIGLLDTVKITGEVKQSPDDTNPLPLVVDATSDELP